MIAIAFGPANMAEALDGLPRIRTEADCVELRLDLFDAPYDLPTLLRERGELPVVVTLRPREEGGRSILPAHERLKVLRSAAEQGAEYVDLEWDAATPGAIAQLKSNGARVILSRHDFVNMPADEWWADLVERGADAVKVVGTAHDVRDNLHILRTLERATKPTIAIAMGEAGLVSRVLALRSEQCLLTYATLGSSTPTAPGQLTARDMREVYGAARLGRDTGWPNTTPGSRATGWTRLRCPSWPTPMHQASSPHFRSCPSRAGMSTAMNCRRRSGKRSTSWPRVPAARARSTRSRDAPMEASLVIGSRRHANSTTSG
jgi:3-dehydroquinate dehydratase type I